MKNSTIDLPVGWIIVSISDLGEIITGTTPSTKQRNRFYGGSIPFVKPPDLILGEFLNSTHETLSSLGKVMGALKRLKALF